MQYVSTQQTEVSDISYVRNWKQTKTAHLTNGVQFFTKH